MVLPQHEPVYANLVSLIQVVDRVGAILGLMGSHDGTNGLHQASYL